MSSEHFAICSWSPDEDYCAKTPFGEIPMFCEGGHRAVELMLLSAAACLNFYLVEYASARKLGVEQLDVRCDGDIAVRPERVSNITTTVKIRGDLDEKEVAKMLKICERACKVMNTLQASPARSLVVELDNG